MFIKLNDYSVILARFCAVLVARMMQELNRDRANQKLPHPVY